MIRRLVAVLVALFVAWLAAGSSDEATAAPSSRPHGYVYEGHHRSVEPDDTASERGPPSTNYNDATQSDTADRWPCGSSARPQPDPVWNDTTYDPAVRPAQVTDGSDTTLTGSHSRDADTCALAGASVAANGVSKFGSLTHAADGIAPYSTQRLITAGHAGEIQAHHLIEKRFADVMGGNTKDWASVVVTRSEHQVFTNEWRQAIPYGSRNVTPAMVNNAARNIYRDYPEILQALGLG